MKKILALLLVSAISMSVLTACGSDENGNGADNSTPEPTPTPKVLYVDPLTGEEQSFDYPQDVRPVAVMVNNIMQINTTQVAWPHYGLSEADVIFEMEVEGGITRMMAIFRDYSQMPQVGPVRSARDQFVQMLFQTSALYVHEGESTYARTMLDYYQYDNAEMEGNSGVIFWDSSITGKAREHTAFTTGQLITDYINEDNLNNDRILEEGEPLPLFNWHDYDLPDRELDSIDVNSIQVAYSSSYDGELIYNPSTQTYTKEHTYNANGQTRTLIDAGNSNLPVEFDNVIILWTPVELYPGDYVPNFDFDYGGVGYYFCNGKVEKLTWTKGAPDSPLKLYEFKTDIELEINPGKSYITVIDLDNYDEFMFDNVPVDVNSDYKTPVVTTQETQAETETQEETN